MRRVLVAALAGVFVAYAGMFGTGDVPMGVRLAYWCGLLMIGSLWAQISLGLLQRNRRIAARPWLVAVTLTVLLAGPGVPLVWAASAAAFGHRLQLHLLGGYVGPVLAISVAMTALNMLAHRRPHPGRSMSQGAGPPRFLARMPLRLRGAELLAVEAEDHFLRLHTDRGSDLILMRLSDAVAELEGIEGAQTHRSWWVAKSAVVDVARGGGRAVFTLKGEIKAPVSRTYAPALRRDGWY